MKIVIFVCVMLVSTSSYALENTKINREIQAWRYLATVQLGQMMRDVFSSMPSDSEEKSEKLIQNIDMAAFTKVLHNALVKVMTADELKAYADFYGSAAGQSVLAKTPLFAKEFMDNVTPIFEAAEKKAKE